MNILCLSISYPTAEIQRFKENIERSQKNSTFYTGNSDSNDIGLLIRNYKGRNKWNNIIKVNN